MSNGNEHIAFLEERLKEIKKRVAMSPDYREMVVLQRMIKELVESRAVIATKFNIGHESTGVKRTGHPHTKEKDMQNSPGANISHGNRIETVYDLVEQAVINNGGAIDFSILVPYLIEEYKMDWLDERTDKNGNKRTTSQHSRIVSYIQIHNKKYPEDIRLHLWPKREKGASRASKYEKVIYVGKQRMAI